MNAAQLKEELDALATMSPAQLREKWQRVFREPAPRFGPDLLARAIAYRLQERVHGGLSASTRKEIERLARRYERMGEVEIEPEVIIKPGTRLVRVWRREQHLVLVLDEGYLYRERRYGSLSQIARDITGAQWSGPRFFGLRRGAKRRAAEPSERADA